jgi:predicted nucleic acid-binding protein
MAGNNPPLYYWDTCLFLAWLKDEDRKSGEMDGVRDIIQKMKRRDARVMTSVLTSVEVLTAKIPVGIDVAFKDLLKRINRQGVDIRVASLAHELRNHYAKTGRSLKVPDAIHLATAIHFRADEFHTFDGQLLSFTGDVGGNRLVICKPETKAPQLDLRKPKQESAPDAR